jgi:pimeloyl-ACP methyl ester carboxylesterase
VPNKRRQIHTLHVPAVGPKRFPPLLFVHGGCTTAGCWEPHFLPYFSRRGFDCHALDLSGHGSSAGRERLDAFGLDDFTDDVAQVAGDLNENAVLIGHSMGTVLIERYLERGEAKGAVFMAPVPASGTLGSALKLAFTEPAFFTEQARATRGEYTAKTLQLMRDVYYSAETTDQDLIRFGPLFQSESRRAVIELSLLAMRFPGRRPSLPVLVIGGERDALFPSSLLGFSALWWNGEIAVIPRAGHTIMLDAHWEEAADRIAQWLEKRFG